MPALNSAQRRERAFDIDLGMAVIAAVRKPGESMTAAEIAAVCGCSKQAIEQEEKAAIEKLQRAARRMAYMEKV